MSSEDNFNAPKPFTDSAAYKRVAQIETAISISPFPVSKKDYTLKVLSEMEDFKYQIASQRRSSCP